MLLEEVLENSPLAVSVKTRVGIKDPDEWEALCGVYAKFPLEELIIHPRLQIDYYSGTPRMETVARALEQTMCRSVTMEIYAVWKIIRK